MLEETMPDLRVLVVEDEEGIGDAVKYSLERDGYRVYLSREGIKGLELARQVRPDLLVLDIMLPGIDGLEIYQILRRESDVPIIMLTARGEEIDRVVGLELGADDYIAKPFSMRELQARIRNLLRRTRTSVQDAPRPTILKPVKAGDLTIDRTSHTITLKDQPLSLRPREFQLLELFLTAGLSPGKKFWSESGEGILLVTVER